MTPLRIGTRGSQLALYQANAVAALLAQHAIACEIVIIKTSGDRLAEATLSEIGGKRLFVKEIEDALLAGSVDLAVHSSKDMPAVLPEGLDVAAVLPREDPRDAIVLPQRAGSERTRPTPEGTRPTPEGTRPTPEGTRPIPAGTRPAPTATDVGRVLSDVGRVLSDPVRSDVGRVLSDPARSIDEVVAEMGSAPRIGTSSVRRIAQLVRVFPAARFVPIRGNLDTRLRKLDSGEFDAIVLASAGLRRLGFTARISATVPPDACVPAPGQGIIAVEIRGDDTRVREFVARLTDRAARAAFDAERAVVRRLGGGCQMPIGAYATSEDDTLRLRAIVVSLDGTRAVRAEASGSAASAVDLGRQVADRLLEQGASEILAHAESLQAKVGGLQP